MSSYLNKLNRLVRLAGVTLVVLGGCQTDRGSHDHSPFDRIIAVKNLRHPQQALALGYNESREINALPYCILSGQPDGDVFFYRSRLFSQPLSFLTRHVPEFRFLSESHFIELLADPNLATIRCGAVYLRLTANPEDSEKLYVQDQTAWFSLLSGAPLDERVIEQTYRQLKKALAIVSNLRFTHDDKAKFPQLSRALAAYGIRSDPTIGVLVGDRQTPKASAKSRWGVWRTATEWGNGNTPSTPLDILFYETCPYAIPAGVTTIVCRELPSRYSVTNLLWQNGALELFVKHQLHPNIENNALVSLTVDESSIVKVESVKGRGDSPAVTKEVLSYIADHTRNGEALDLITTRWLQPIDDHKVPQPSDLPAYGSRLLQLVRIKQIIEDPRNHEAIILLPFRTESDLFMTRIQAKQCSQAHTLCAKIYGNICQTPMGQCVNTTQLGQRGSLSQFVANLFDERFNERMIFDHKLRAASIYFARELSQNVSVANSFPERLITKLSQGEDNASQYVLVTQRANNQELVHQVMCSNKNSHIDEKVSNTSCYSLIDLEEAKVTYSPFPPLVRSPLLSSSSEPGIDALVSRLISSRWQDTIFWNQLFHRQNIAASFGSHLIYPISGQIVAGGTATDRPHAGIEEFHVDIASYPSKSIISATSADPGEVRVTKVEIGRHKGGVKIGQGVGLGQAVENRGHLRQREIGDFSSSLAEGWTDFFERQNVASLSRELKVWWVINEERHIFVYHLEVR